MSIPGPPELYSTGEKKCQGIQPSRTQDKLGRRNFIWPSATGLKPMADNTVIVVSLGVICGILINQCSFSFQISEAETQSDLSSLGIWKETMNLSVAGISRDSLQILLLRHRFKHFSKSWNWNVTHQQWNLLEYTDFFKNKTKKKLHFGLLELKKINSR